MTVSTLVRRGRRLAVLAGAAGVLTLVAPAVAHAATADWAGTLYPGAPRQCVGATAQSAARVIGTAGGSGVRFVVLRDGVQIVNTNAGTTSYGASWAVSGFYEFCAKNPAEASGPSTVVLKLRTDNDFSRP